MAQTANLQQLQTGWSLSLWTVPGVDVTCFKMTFSFTVKPGLLQVTVANLTQIGLKSSTVQLRLIDKTNLNMMQVWTALWEALVLMHQNLYLFNIDLLPGKLLLILLVLWTNSSAVFLSPFWKEKKKIKYHQTFTAFIYCYRHRNKKNHNRVLTLFRPDVYIVQWSFYVKHGEIQAPQPIFPALHRALQW